jgi:serine/threonine-protein kinase
MTALPEPGSRIAGKYVVERELGAGAVGIVYSATHEELRQRVAIKLLREAAPVASLRMLHEARATVALQSDHVVRVMDVGRDDGRVFLVMEQLEGSDLASLLRARGRLPAAEAVDYVLQACAGVAEAHARGIVHRDLKPSNLFLTHRADGSPLVKVLDFGVSKSSDPGEPNEPGERNVLEGSLTGTFELLGSPLYMSPEQVRGAKNVDHRTDIWSLGVILFRLLSGQPPLGGAATSVSGALASVVGDEAARLRELVPDVPRELEAVVNHCLAKSPGERFASVAELATALAPFGTQDGRAAVVRLVRDRAVLPPRRGGARGRWPLLAATAIVLFTIAAGALAISRHVRAAGTSETAPPSTASALAAPVASPSPVTAPAATDPASAAAPPAPPPVPPPPATVSPRVRPNRPVARPHPPGNSSVVRSAATNDRY